MKKFIKVLVILIFLIIAFFGGCYFTIKTQKIETVVKSEDETIVYIEFLGQYFNYVEE